jgi:putative DNA primase/helicase
MKHKSVGAGARFNYYNQGTSKNSPFQPPRKSEPRPLELTARPGAPVLIVEGEKTADAAVLLFPDYVTTSPGGAGAFDRADWSPLVGRDCRLWPDHDAPGMKYHAGVAGHLPKLRMVDIPATFPEGWDLADERPDGADLRAMLDAAIPPKQKPEAVPKAKKPNARTLNLPASA